MSVAVPLPAWPLQAISYIDQVRQVSGQLSIDTRGKGFYEFNLRFNEEKNKSASDESAAFENLSDEEAFFIVDDSVPSLTGKIAYVDLIPAGSELPTSSKVTYNLNANKLTKPQVMNFFKLWMICVGPTNDE